MTRVRYSRGPYLRQACVLCLLGSWVYGTGMGTEYLDVVHPIPRLSKDGESQYLPFHVPGPNGRRAAPSAVQPSEGMPGAQAQQHGGTGLH